MTATLTATASASAGIWSRLTLSYMVSMRHLPYRGGMTVAELIAELLKMPPDLPVTRYCDEVVESVELREYGRDEGRETVMSDLPDHDTRHVALW